MVSKQTLIVVPTYAVILVDAAAPSRTIATYSVTRDGWYILGQEVNGAHLLMNRAFEPLDPSKNDYTTVPLKYPHGSGLEAFALRQNGSAFLPAEPLPSNKFLDGTTISDSRSNNNESSGVMLHIGGYYEKPITGEESCAASFGCFGFISSAQTYSQKSHAQSMIDANNVQGNGTTNAEYDAL
jgi:hypothetical protein